MATLVFVPYPSKMDKFASILWQVMKLTTEVLSSTEATENTVKGNIQGEFLQWFSVFRGSQ